MVPVAVAVLLMAAIAPLRAQSTFPRIQEASILDVLFADPEFSPANELLFTASTLPLRYNRYTTLFVSDLSGDAPPVTRQLTYFPEHIDLIEGSNELLIQNRFGTFLTSKRRTALSPVRGIPGFSSGAPIAVGGVMPVVASPSGRWLLYFQPHSALFGSVVLKDTESEEEIVVTRQVGLTIEGPPVLWSPDSSFFLYSKDGTIYYYSIAQLQSNRVISESLRGIGVGHIGSVEWGPHGILYLITGSTLYAIRNQELFARGVYQDLVRVGLVVGNLPFSYNPVADSFRVSPNGARVLIIKNRRDLFLHSLKGAKHALRSSYTIPYNSFLVDSEVARVLWVNSNTLLLLTRDLAGDELRNRLYRITISEDGADWNLVPAPEQRVRDVALSNSGERVAVTTPNQIYVRDALSWEELATHRHTEALTTLWSNEDQLIVAGAYVIEERSPLQDVRRVITLSQAIDHGFDPSSNRILATAGGDGFYYDTALAAWQSSGVQLPTGARERNTATPDYRVFLGESEGSRYRNQIYIRHLNGYNTTGLIQPLAQRYAPFPQHSEEVNLVHFRHGSRIRSRKVALALNAIDSVEGLNQLLAVLRDYAIRATFFVNGNFVRSYPKETRTITEAGHEIGSLFFSYFDMTDIKYQIDAEFVQQGLSNTEDIYHQATNRELALLWHAPFYFVNPTIIEAARQVGYTYIGRDVETDTWLPSAPNSLARVDTSGITVADRIARVLQQKKPGSIISLRIGRAPTDPRPFPELGTLSDNLPLLLNTLIAEGYSVVPVSEIYQEAR